VVFSTTPFQAGLCGAFSGVAGGRIYLVEGRTMAVVDAVAAVERTRSVTERVQAARLERLELERTRAEEARVERAEAGRTQNERIDADVADDRLRAARDADNARLDSLLIAREDQSSFADQLAELARVEGLRAYRVQADQQQALTVQDQLVRFNEQAASTLAVA
jgi:hypothetical protein